jgi:DnaJ-class molecular chaperone
MPKEFVIVNGCIIAPCPRCEGTGRTREQTPTGYCQYVCKTCTGLGWVKVRLDDVPLLHPFIPAQ